MATPISQLGLNELFPTLKALEKEGADEEFVRWVRRPENARHLMDFYRDQMIDADTVYVPDLPSVDLLKRLIGEMDQAFRVMELYHAWDFVAEKERGKYYQAFTWEPGEKVTFQEVLDHFHFLGADGNTAAFIAWLTKRRPNGFCATLPSDRSRLFSHPQSGKLLFPEWDEDGDRRNGGHTLLLEWELVPDGKALNGTYVAFKEVTP